MGKSSIQCRRRTRYPGQSWDRAQRGTSFSPPVFAKCQLGLATSWRIGSCDCTVQSASATDHKSGAMLHCTALSGHGGCLGSDAWSSDQVLDPYVKCSVLFAD